MNLNESSVGGMNMLQCVVLVTAPDVNNNTRESPEQKAIVSFDVFKAQR